MVRKDVKPSIHGTCDDVMLGRLDGMKDRCPRGVPNGSREGSLEEYDTLTGNGHDVRIAHGEILVKLSGEQCPRAQRIQRF